MKYSLYKNIFEDTTQFRLYLKLPDGDIVCYKFQTMDHMISNLPNATRWFGKLILGEDPYYLYPIDESGISVGEYELIQVHEKFIKIKFTSGLITGEWYLRNIKGGEVLFWKPKPEGFICPMRTVEITELEKVTAKEDKISIQQAFAVPVDINNNEFSGPCMTPGIVTGMDRVSTLFTESFIKKFYKKMVDNMDKLVVDIDHELLTVMRGNIPTEEEKEMVKVGSITELKLKENNRINYIWCKGQTTYPIPTHAGLSVTLQTDAVWDDELNIYVAVSGDPVGIAITDKIQPACKVCWVQ